MPALGAASREPGSFVNEASLKGSRRPADAPEIGVTRGGGGTMSESGPHLDTRGSDPLAVAERWRMEGRGVAIATVIATWGSSPRPTGSQLALDADGHFVGSVSGGCIEGAVIAEGIEAIRDGRPRVLDFGVSNEQAWEVGLTCGGKVQVYVEPVED